MLGAVSGFALVAASIWWQMEGEMAAQDPTKSEANGRLYVRAMEATRGLVAGVRASQWAGPTPCSEWDVRTLVNHLVYENLWAAELFPGKTMAEVGDRYEGGDLVGPNPLSAYDHSMAAAKAAVEAPGVMRAVCHLSFGDLTGAEYAAQLFQDLLVHGWDVAKATGQSSRLNPTLVRAVLPIAEVYTRQARQWGVFGEELRVPSSAGPQEYLLALFGRRANWKAPSTRRR